MKTLTHHGVTVHRVNAVQNKYYGGPKRIHLWAYRIGKFTCWSTYELSKDEIEGGVKALAESSAAASAPTRVTLRAFERALTGGTGSFKDQGGKAELMFINPAKLSLSRDGRRVTFVAPCGATGYFTRREAEKLVEALAS